MTGTLAHPVAPAVTFQTVATADVARRNAERRSGEPHVVYPWANGTFVVLPATAVSPGTPVVPTETGTLRGPRAETVAQAATPLRPYGKSRTRRLDAAQDARRHLDAYRNGVKANTDDADPAQRTTAVLDLLRAMAACERALAAQTSGRYGYEHANVLSVGRRMGIEV